MTRLQFEPVKWHFCTEKDSYTCSEGVNCYSYILNNPLYFWSVPGLGFIKAERKDYIQLFNSYFKDFSKEQFRDFLVQGALTDGLRKADQDSENTVIEYLVALYFSDTEYDFHWYRRDDDGHWSHKDGYRPASNTDPKGNSIDDVQSTRDNQYPVFGGYFYVPRNGVLLKPMIAQ